MLTSKVLAELLGDTPLCEVSEIAKKTTGRGLQQFSAENSVANYAKLLPDDDLTTSPTSHPSQQCELVEKPIPEPFLASSQTSQRGSPNPLTATHCRECDFPAPVDFMSLCPFCGTTHPFASDDEISLTLTSAEWTVAQATLTTDQKNARLVDLRRDPGIARFWAALFDPSIAPTND